MTTFQVRRNTNAQHASPFARPTISYLSSPLVYVSSSCSLPFQSSNSTSNNPQSEFSKKEEFRRYLEKTGVLDALIKVLVGLYEEPDRPSNALDYIKRYLGAPSSVDVEGLKKQNEELKNQVEKLKKQLKDQQPSSAPS